MSMKKLLSSFLALALAVTMSGCASGTPEKSSPIGTLPVSATPTTTSEPTETLPGDSPDLPSSIPTVSFADGRSTQLVLLDSGTLQIERKERASIQKTNDGIWTVFVYLCASNLESDYGAASDDISEMIEATKKSSRLRFIVEAGGTTEWQQINLDPEETHRLVIADGTTSVIQSSPYVNMGASSSLSDFLDWGTENYLSEYMGVVLWNHGGGSITGACFDDAYGGDSLSLLEIEAAFNSVFDKMTTKFDFIGFDACLMSTIETANILVPHADYMIASAEVEPGSGWDYTTFGRVIRNSSETDVVTLGKEICDSYYSSLSDDPFRDEITIALIDLSKTNDFLRSFNVFAEKLFTAANDQQTLAKLVRIIGDVEKYGVNNHNMIDLGKLIKACAPMIGADTSSINALEDCITYSVIGKSRKGILGIGTYYPICVQGSNELSIFKGIAISPYYTSFCDLVAFGGSSHGNTSDYDGSDWFGEDSFFWNDDYSYDYAEENFSYGDDNSSWYDYWGTGEDEDDFNFDIGSSTLGYSVEPHLTDDGYYTFTLNEYSMYYLDRVFCNILLSVTEDDGSEYMLDMGTDDFLEINWQTGEVTDSFDGSWFALPDGQPLACFLMEAEPERNVYCAPVFVNDEFTYLQIVQYFDGEYYESEITGIWEVFDESGASARDIYDLEIGDIICPYYDAYETATGEWNDYYYGDNYEYVGDNTISYEPLYDGDYYYGFEIYDIFENVIYTDFALFTVEGEDLYFSEETWGWADDYEYSDDYGDDSSWDDDYWDSDYWLDWLDSLTN